MQCLPEYAKWLKQFASPTLFGFTSPDAQLMALTDPQGIPLQGTNGPITAGPSPEQMMLDVLTNVQNGAAAAFPAESKVQWIEMRGMGNPFLFAFRWFNEEITMGTLGQPMTTMSQKYGTHALGRVQQDTQDTIVRQIKAGIGRTFQRDVLRLWVRLNYGEKWLPFTPKPNLGQLEEPNLQEDLNAYSLVGFQLHPSQYPEVDKKLGLPPRTGNWMQDMLLGSSAGKPGAPAGSQAQSQPSQPSKPSQPSATLPSGKKRPQQTTAAAKMAEEEQAERLQALKDHYANRRWHEAVAMAEALEKETGIKLDPNAPPPTMERMQEMAGELAAAVR
jgi:phage gp29-like protein